jgi:hypothetical protein
MKTVIFFMLQIRKDRAGEQIDKLLLKNVIDIFVEIDMGDIELLDETANDYKLKAEPKPPAKTCETMVSLFLNIL